jgi:tRNA G10  N-methylase Trm11
VRCARGLFRVAIDELKYRKIVPPGGTEPLVLRQRNHDLLFLQRASRIPTCSSIRTAEEILRCLIYGRYKISKAQLDVLAQALAASDEEYRIAVSVEGTHFVRRDVRRFLERELASRGARIAAESSHTLFVFCIDAVYYVGTLWSQEGDAAYRQFRIAERPGALPPTIAAAMAFLGKVEADETVLDPVCGTGTLLAEAYAYCPSITPICVDLDPDAIAMARQNLGFSPRARFLNQDATALKLPAQSVHLFLANLPFGKRYGQHETNAALYARLLNEMSRLGMPGRWRAVLLTADTEAAQAALAAHPSLTVRKSFRLQVKGEAATMYVVQPAVVRVVREAIKPSPSPDRRRPVPETSAGGRAGGRDSARS